MGERGLYLGDVLGADGERGEALRLDADSLTTHGVIVGMTGSGKTGLGVVFIEEALRAGVGVLAIDPKGDLTNLALTFPELDAPSFAPWVDPDEARREGLDVAALGERVAAAWREGLADWGLGGADLRALRAAADVTVYTPGSRDGVGLNVVGSLAPPPGAGDDDRHAAATAVVTGLLGLAGVEADPLASPDAALLSVILDQAWRAGRTMDYAALIAQVLDPPVRRLGVLDLDTVMPPDERRRLALRLNGLLASPGAAAWLDGLPLDIGALTRTPVGGPRCAVVSIAHLDDAERQVVVAALLGRVVAEMRRSAGTASLRTLLYIDELAGFAPPVAAPPSKAPLLTLLKTGRAFGVGCVLATQNPVDLDYRLVANAATWAVGRLSTEQDRSRLLGGLASAGRAETAALDAAVASLVPRRFVLSRVDGSPPITFATRWALSYLRGPVTGPELARLPPGEYRPAPPGATPSPAAAPPGDPPSGPVPSPAAAPLADPPSGAVPSPAAAAGAADRPAPAPELAADETPVPPPTGEGLRSAFLAAAAAWGAAVPSVPGGRRFEAALAVRAHLRFDDARAGVDHLEEWEAVWYPLTDPLEPAAAVAVDHDPRDLDGTAPAGARYRLPDVDLTRGALVRDAVRRLRAHLVREQRLALWRNPELKLTSRPGEDEAGFRIRCAAAAREAAAAEQATLRGRYEQRAAAKESVIARERRRLDELDVDVASRRRQEMVAGAGAVLGVLLGAGRRGAAGRAARTLQGASSRRGQTARTLQRRESGEARLAEAEAALADLLDALDDDLAAIDERWRTAADQRSALDVGLEAADIDVEDPVLVWVPTAD